MKKSFYFIVFICFSQLAFGQNLVPNPSFEDYDTCPTSTDQVYRASGWSIDINSSDYYNSCAIYSSMVGIPNNGVGYQCPANGNAYCGFHAYKGILPSLQQYREYIGTSLSNPLIVGQKYYISFKISLANESYCAVNRIGIKFTNVNYGDTTILPVPAYILNNTASFCSVFIVSDTLEWTTISGSYIADSSYQYMLIGNFFNDSNTDTSVLYGNSCFNSYYYIDDICVSTDSLTCVIPYGTNTCGTGYTTETITGDLIAYPNPAKDILTICQNNEQNTRLRISNLYGQLLFEKEFYQECIEIELNEYHNGIYILQVFQNHKEFNKKISVIR